MPEVEFKANGGTGTGYLAVPESGSGPGVVVLHEWWGLDSSVTKLADAFADEGFVALAPDLYHGETTEQPDEAQQKLMAMNMDKTETELRGAVDYVSEHEAYNGSGIGAVGFCMGGGLAVWAGAANPKVDAVVTYYYGCRTASRTSRTSTPRCWATSATPTTSSRSTTPRRWRRRSTRRPTTTSSSSSTKARATPSPTTTTGWGPTTRATPRRRGTALSASSRST